MDLRQWLTDRGFRVARASKRHGATVEVPLRDAAVAVERLRKYLDAIGADPALRVEWSGSGPALLLIGPVRL